MTKITKDRDFKTDINIESQTINYIKNPEKFKGDLEKAKNEIYDIYHAVDSTVNLQGKEDRNILEQLGEVRQAKTIYNVIGSRLDIAENQEDIAKIFEGVSEDLDYKVKVIYTDPSNSPQLIGVDKNGNKYIKDGTAYVDKDTDTGIGYILVNTESPANSTKAGVIGTIAEEQSHVIGKKEGRQKVVPDGSEKGLESLGKPTNDYFKKQYSKNDKAIELKSDGKDYSNVDFGENVGDSRGFTELKGIFLDKIVGTEDTLISAKDYLPMEFQIREKKIKNILEKEKNNISSKMVHEELIKLGQVGGQNIIKNKYEGIYVLENEDIRKQFFDEKDNLRLDKFDPENWGKIENSKKFKEGVEEVRKKSQEYYLKNKNIIKTEAIAKINTVVKLAGDTDIFTDNDLKFALGKTTITSRIIIDRGVPYLRYNLTDKFQDPADINIEWGKPYQMLGPSRIIPLFDVMGLEK